MLQQIPLIFKVVVFLSSKRSNILSVCKGYNFAYQCMFLFYYNMRVNSIREHSPGKHRAFDAQLVPGTRHFEFNNVPPLGHLRTTKNILSSFPSVLRVKGFKHRHFGTRRESALSFFSRSDSFRDLLYAVLLSWNSHFYKKNWQLVFLYIGRMDWWAGHLTIIQ